MATEIMRPYDVVSSGSVVCIPEVDDKASLINDVVPDDDSTYINITQTGITNCFDFKVASDKLKSEYQNVTKAVVVMRIKNSDLNYFIAYRQFTGSINYVDTKIESTIINQWETVAVQLDLEIFKNCVAAGEDGVRVIIFKNGSSSGKSTCDVKISQIYLEVTYAEDETETIYIKQDNTWVATPCTIYKKQNDEWTLVDSSVFEEGTRFVFQEIE